MSLLTVDQEKCKRDGHCVAECPARIIEMKDKESFPSPVDRAEELCINCGHCVSVCPHGAMSLNTMKPDECPPMRRDLLPTGEQTEHFFRARRSIRTYKAEPVDQATLARLIEMARYAPSGHNLQPVHWLVIDSPDEMKRLTSLVIDWMRVMITDHPEVAGPMHFDLVVRAWENGLDRVLRGAPQLIVAHGTQAVPTVQAACTIALAYLELAAFSLGLGACWAGYFNSAAGFYPPLKKALALPKGHQCYGAMMIGYPKFRYHRLPLRDEARVTWRR
jgi:nitroreductase/NAD-dependent dihydropyrimidine dehydrogenase PreA subunit